MKQLLSPAIHQTFREWLKRKQESRGIASVERSREATLGYTRMNRDGWIGSAVAKSAVAGCDADVQVEGATYYERKRKKCDCDFGTCPFEF